MTLDRDDVDWLLLVFDGDDTLWETEPLYDRARSEASLVVESEGFDASRFDTLQREIDLRNVARLGLSSDRFPTSCVQAYEQLARHLGVEAEPAVSARVRQAAASVFEMPAPLLPGATEVLTTLAASHLLVLLTKGDRAVQAERVAHSGLAMMFQRVEIVEAKTAGIFTEIVNSSGVPLERSWSIGNSLPSDIEPALEAGMAAVWLDAHVWEHERRAHQVQLDHRRLHVAASLYEVPKIIEAHVVQHR